MASKASVLFIVSWLFAAAAYAGPMEDGIAFFKKGKYKEAHDAFQYGLSFQPDDPSLLYYYALTLHKLSDEAGARKIYQQIVTQSPNSGAAAYAKQALGLIPKAPSAPSASSNPSAPSATNLPTDLPVEIYPGALNVKWEKPYEAPNLPPGMAEIIKQTAGDQIKFHLDCAKGTEGQTGAKIVSFYKTEFTSKGWQYDPNNSNSDQAGAFLFKKQPSAARVIVTPADGSVQVTIAHMAIAKWAGMK